MTKQTIKDISVQGKRALVRVDFNVPQDANGKITDDARIQKTLPTIRYLLDNGAKAILMSHLGRPNGADLKYSLKPAADHLSKLLGRSVRFVPDCVGPGAEKAAAALRDGEIALLENLRFHAEEEKNDPEFSKLLSRLGDVYVNDAFGTAHRAHASTAGVTQFLPAVAGFLLAKEIEYFDRALERPARPFAAILGGAKVVDKIKVIEHLLTKVDSLLIGGAMAYTFLKAKGVAIGSSKFDSEGFPTAQRILEGLTRSKVQLYLPEDHVVTRTVSEHAETKTCGLDIPEGWIGADIGPKTVAQFKDILKPARTVVWNGPLGIFEMKPFSGGTREIAQCLAQLKGATTVIGGGETAAAISELGLENSMSHVSTGGGASLEYLEGRPLPGIEALLNRDRDRDRVRA